jgi:hypothetical protein
VGKVVFVFRHLSGRTEESHKYRHFNVGDPVYGGEGLVVPNGLRRFVIFGAFSKPIADYTKNIQFLARREQNIQLSFQTYII